MSLRRDQIPSGTNARAHCCKPEGIPGTTANITGISNKAINGNNQGQLTGPKTKGIASINPPQALRESVRINALTTAIDIAKTTLRRRRFKAG
ncbi:MAG: Uncharacterised protein [Prochlorococcus marinus str. MIT 9215]|nr:MAG: Uncharacterised protein [Prochlorococcus marinus str. MIT 9215]